MEDFPVTPSLTDDVCFGGHLWIQALPTSRRLRFEVVDSGLVVFGDHERAYRDADLPLWTRSAASEVRDRLDRDALLASVDDPGSLTFFGVAPVYRGVDYRWDDVPAFLGVDVWSDGRDGFLPPDAAASAYRRMGLAVPAVVEQEAAARRTDLDAYVEDGPPEVEEYGGAAARVLVRDKSGGRSEAVYEPDAGGQRGLRDLEQVVDGFVTEDHLHGITGDREDRGGVSVDEAVERALDDLVRRRYASLYRADELRFDQRNLRSAVAERVSRYLG